MNELNQLSNITRSGTLTVSGATSTNASSVTVNGASASLYDDRTFAKDGLTITNGVNAYTAAGSDSLGRSASDAITVSLPSTASFTYDANGNMTSDGNLGYDYDDENQLVHVWGTNWMSEFVYDGQMRRRVSRTYESPAAETTFVTGVSLTTLRNDADRWVGLKLTVGTKPLVVTQLGRWVVSGNNQSHAVRLVGWDGLTVPGASVTLNTSGATAGNEQVFTDRRR